MPPGRREALILGGVGLAAALVGALTGPMLLQSGSGAAELLGTPFADLAGRPRRLLEWNGKILVCNFWATWCAPCREEIPMLVQVREKYASEGMEIVGIAVENNNKIYEFSSNFKITYPLLIGGVDAIDLMRKLGNRAGGLPFTVVLDRLGTIVERKLGALRRLELESWIEAMMR